MDKGKILQKVKFKDYFYLSKLLFYSILIINQKLIGHSLVV